MYVNLVFAVVAVVGALALLHNQAPAEKPKVDIPGVLTVSGGLFAIVYGFSHAQTTSWGNQVTVGMLATGVLLLMAFAVLQARVSNPLLPLKVIADRNRGASFLAIGISGSAMFAVFLFLTYYLQQTRGYTPIATGLAFMPMTAAIMVTAVLSTTKLRGRFGPRLLVGTGMALGCLGMLALTQVGLQSSYAGAILPSLLAIGVGMGLVFATALNNATLGVGAQDAGVASAMVSASQQVGGSLGTALLSTLAASAAASFISGSGAGRPTQALLAHAAMHGYTTAFAWAAGIFAVGAVVALTLYERGVKQVEVGAEPVLAH
jgi:hypothetical protein